MHVLYTDEEMMRIRARARRCGALMGLIAAAGLAACVALCFFVTTGTAERLRVTAIAVSTLTGWAVILLQALVRAPDRAVSAHMEGMLAARERECFEGALSLDRTAIHLPKSIWIRRATLTDGERSVSLTVLENKVRQLPAEGTRVRVETVRKYIAGWEACHDQA